ncbi:MAG TPA: hypothetical protein VFT29_04275 [Gemmatimonadaceae bacterium]|nr:hypothetical protein [Gemmatimonadaceae bacterium]
MKAGVALPIVLLMLALTSALVVGGAFVTRQQVVMIRDRSRGDYLEGEAEQAVIQAIASWDSAGWANQAVGSALQLPSRAVMTVRTDSWITRLGPRTYWVVAESQSDARPSLRRRLGLLVRVDSGTPAPVPERPWSELP